MILTDLAISAGAFEARTGWVIKPEGACQGDVCVPLPDPVSRPDGRIDAEVLAERLGMPLVADERAGIWSLGPATTATGRMLTTAIAPDLVLPDADGNPFHLESLRGQKVLLVAWASW